MIEDIKRIGIDDKLYNEMINTLGYDTVLNMACNYKLIMQNNKRINIMFRVF